MKPHGRNGFTLIELLCVTAIIGILASLLLGAVSRAFARVKRFEWDQNSPVLVNRFRERMTEICGRTPEYPALSVDQLYETSLIDSKMRDFLKDRRVKFFPFSSATPETSIILRVSSGGKKDLITYAMKKQEVLPKDP